MTSNLPIGVTTADWRRKALEFEKICDWRLAAACWDNAIAVYPTPHTALAQHDMQKMRNRRDACVNTVLQDRSPRLA